MKKHNILKKSVRNIIRNKSSYIACIVVLSLGICVFTGMLSAGMAADEATDIYFENSNYADAFADVLMMPESVVERIKNIDGIKNAEGSLIQNVKGKLSDTNDSSDLVNIKMVGVDPLEPPAINQFELHGGTLDTDNDIFLSKDFYLFHNFENGDSIYMIMNGERREYIIRGYVDSALNNIVNGEQPLYGKNSVGFVTKRALENATGYNGMITECYVELEAGTVFKDVSADLKQELESYGLESLYEKKDYPNYQMIKSNVSISYMIAAVFPVIFMTISVVMLYIILKRLVENERTEIGVLKAIGFSNREIISGYLTYSFFIGVAALILGMLLGYALGSGFYGMMLQAYAIQGGPFSMPLSVILIALVISVLTCVIAVAMGAKSVTAIEPAEAMRSANPAAAAGTTMGGGFLSKILSFRQILSFRSIWRKKKRAVLTIFSIVVSFTLVNLFYASAFSYNKAMSSRKTVLEPYDLRISLVDFASRTGSIESAYRIQGVTKAEGLLQIPVTINCKNREIKMTLSGVEESSSLYNVVDELYEKQKIPEHSVMINALRAEQLKAGIGDELEISSPYLKEPFIVEVSSIVQEPERMGCYMNIDALSKAFMTDSSVNQILLTVEPGYKTPIQNELIYAKNVLEVVDQNAAVEKLLQDSATLMTLFYMFIIMAVLMCYGILNNLSRISMAEKLRELITMRVIGFTMAEVSSVNSFENVILFVPSILIGMIAVHLLRGPFSSMVRDETFALTLEINLFSIVLSIFCCLISMLLSNYMSRRQIEKYDVAEIMKERE